METNPKKQRQYFSRDYASGQWSMSELCARYPISRPTGYKWIDRIEAEGLKAVDDRSRAPNRHPNRTPEHVEHEILVLREKYGWGATKLREILDRHGQLRKHRRRQFVLTKQTSEGRLGAFCANRGNRLAEQEHAAVVVRHGGHAARGRQPARCESHRAAAEAESIPTALQPRASPRSTPGRLPGRTVAAPPVRSAQSLVACRRMCSARPGSPAASARSAAVLSAKSDLPAPRASVSAPARTRAWAIW